MISVFTAYRVSISIGRRGQIFRVPGRLSHGARNNRLHIEREAKKPRPVYKGFEHLCSVSGHFEQWLVS